MLSDSASRLSAALAPNYRIEHELGAGGMATVLEAEDVRHQRRVAVKVLHPELAESLAGERFLREISLTANLRHPNILPLYDSGSAAGLLYYVMPIVRGESLRDRLTRERQLSMTDALRIIRDVAGALGYAHSQGVIHRDIKPENILLEGEHAFVADFGIARAVNAAGDEKLTQTGLSIGTPTYMSPEQAMGETRLDARSDVYALGAVLYEMLAGEPPHTGASAQAILAKRMVEPVPRVSVLRETVPPQLEQLITRALSKAAADRPADGGEFLRLLDGAESFAASSASKRRGIPRSVLIAAVVLVVALAGGLVMRMAGAPRESRSAPLIAVLPFRNLAGEPEQYFADGLTEEVANRISGISGLSVLARTMTAGYQQTEESFRRLHDKLGATYVLSGSVRWERPSTGISRIRVAPQLIRTTDGKIAWNSSYEMELSDVFGIQSRIAIQVAQALGVTLGAGDTARIARRPTNDVAAYDHVMRGNYLLAKRTPESLERAVAEYQEALRIDSAYSRALANIAYAYTIFGDWGWKYEGLTPSELRAKALEYSERALAIDSTSAPGWLTRAYILTQEDPIRMRGAVPAFERALALDSTTSEGWYQFGQALMMLGRDSGAAAAYRRAFALDPQRPMSLMSLSAMRRKAGQLEEARRLIDSAVMASRTVTSPYVRVIRGLIALNQGRLSDAKADAELALALDTGYTIPARSLLARVYAAQGDSASARAELARALSQLPQSDPAPTAVLYSAGALIALGRSEEALSLIERARPRGAQLWFYLRNPEFNSVRENPRFKRVVSDADPRGKETGPS